MAYVMVPVPEEFVTEVMQYVVRLGVRAQLDPWDRDEVARLFDEADETSKMLLSVVARGTLAQGHVAENDAAEQLQMQVREVHGILREVVDWAEENNHSAPVQTRKNEEVMSSGRVRERRVLYMDRVNAEWIRQIEKEELASSPHALGGLDG